MNNFFLKLGKQFCCLKEKKNLVFLFLMVRQLVDKERENNRFELYLSKPNTFETVEQLHERFFSINLWVAKKC